MEDKHFSSFISDQMTITHHVIYQGKKYPIAQYERGRNLGFGKFSDVYEVRQISSAILKQNLGRELVLKQMLANQNNNQILFQNQINALLHLNDFPSQKYFVKLYDYWRDEKYFCLAFQKCNKGSLYELLAYTRQYQKPLQKEHFLYFAYAILRALEALHSSGIIHRDIKPQNILLDDNLNLKLIDFGLSCKQPQVKQSSIKIRDRHGTPLFMAPEVLQAKNGYNQKVDIWGLGVSLYYLVFSKYPLAIELSVIEKKNHIEVCDTMRDKIKESEIDFTLNQFITANNLQTIVQLIKLMLQREPEKRKTAKQLLELPIFQDLKIEQIKQHLKEQYLEYFYQKITKTTKWKKQISFRYLQMPLELSQRLKDKKKVQIIEVLHIDKYGFFLLLSNNSLFAYFNDHTIYQYSRSSSQYHLREYEELEQQERLKHQEKINKIRILLYVKDNYFKEFMEMQATDILAGQYQGYEYSNVPYCGIQKIFYKDRDLFVRLTNQTFQIFFQKKNPPQNEKEQRFISKFLTLNNHMTCPQRISFSKKDKLYEYDNYSVAIQYPQCAKYIQYVRKVFINILDNSSISLQKYGYKRIA